MCQQKQNEVFDSWHASSKQTGGLARRFIPPGPSKQMTVQISIGRVRGISTSFYVQPSWKLDEKVRQVEGARGRWESGPLCFSTAGMGGDRKHSASDIDEAAEAKQYP